MSTASGQGTSMNSEAILCALRKEADPERAEHAYSFFKCGPGEYGEGDRFLGVPVPVQRSIARRYRDLPLGECENLLLHELHEARLTGLLILTEQMKRAVKGEDLDAQERIVSLYLRRKARINNWDLVDTTAPKILGPYLLKRERIVLY